MKYVSHSSFPSFVLAYIPLDAPIASSALSNIVSYSIVNVFCGLSALLIGIVALAVALLPVADNFNDFVVSPVGIADVTVVVVPLTSFVAFASISSPLLYSTDDGLSVYPFT